MLDQKYSLPEVLADYNHLRTISHKTVLSVVKSELVRKYSIPLKKKAGRGNSRFIDSQDVLAFLASLMVGIKNAMQIRTVLTEELQVALDTQDRLLEIRLRDDLEALDRGDLEQYIAERSELGAPPEIKMFSNLATALHILESNEYVNLFYFENDVELASRIKEILDGFHIKYTHDYDESKITNEITILPPCSNRKE